MNSESLRTLQLLELKILLEFRRICDKHHLKYFLHGGTLLGAVRHHGFIPWDDDIDVGMLRSDYDKFLVVCEREGELSPEYSLHHIGNDAHHPLPFAKLRIDGTDYREQCNGHIDMNHGIWLDIFPFDNVPDSSISREINRIEIYKLSAAVYTKYDFNYDLDVNKISKTLNEKLNAALDFVLKYLLAPLSASTLIKLRTKAETKYNAVQTRGVREWTCTVGPASLFEDVVNLEFEGYIFSVPKGYDEWLKICYGDYMQLPPEDKRICHSPFQPDFGKYASIKTLDDLNASQKMN